MGERKLESITEADNGFYLYGFPQRGFSLKFVSGPDAMKDVKPGALLTIEDHRRGQGERQSGLIPERKARSDEDCQPGRHKQPDT